MEPTFHLYEDTVLPLLKNHNGRLLYRIRPENDAFIYAGEDKPYEIHLLSFVTENDFERFKQDDERKKYAPLFQESVEKVMLVEGRIK